MVQAYGFTPEQSTKMLDVFQHADEDHEQNKTQTKQNEMLSRCLL